MNYWLIKSEPNTWSWTQQKNVSFEPWDGVRNFQAQAYLKQMKINDLAYFYHSGKYPAIVGIVEIIKEFYFNSDNSRFGLVDVKFKQDLKNTVNLTLLKNDHRLQELKLIKQPRLSVMPIPEFLWSIIYNLSNTCSK